MNKGHIDEFFPSALTCMGRSLANPNLSHRKYKVAPLLPQSRMLKSFHVAIIISLLIARPNISVTILFKSTNIKWILLSILLCGSSGATLYFLWDKFGFANDLPIQVKALGLNSSMWPLFIAYFALVNPF